MIERTANSITLSWGPPEDTGGRNDITYRLCYQEEDDDMTLVCIPRNETRGTATGKYNHMSACPPFFVACTQLHVDLLCVCGGLGWNAEPVGCEMQSYVCHWCSMQG